MGFEGWNHAYYVKDYSSVNATTSVSNIATDHKLGSHGTSFHHEVGVESNIFGNHSSFSDSQQHMELPRLANEECVEERFGNAATNCSQYIDWKNPENMLTSTSDFTGHENFALDVEDQNQIGYFPGCFPES